MSGCRGGKGKAQIPVDNTKSFYISKVRSQFCVKKVVCFSLNVGHGSVRETAGKSQIVLFCEQRNVSPTGQETQNCKQKYCQQTGGFVDSYRVSNLN